MAVLQSTSSGADTTDQASISTGAFAVVGGQLTVLIVAISDLAPSPGQIVITNTVGGRGAGFVPVASATFRGGLNSVFFFVSAALELAVNHGWTITFPAAGTGICWSVTRIQGMARSGLGAIRQVSDIQSNHAAATPTVTFPAACLTENPVMTILANETNPPGISAGAGWSGFANTGYATPTTGFQISGRSSGFTGTTAPYNNPSATEYAVFGVEFDTSLVTPSDRPVFEAGIGV